MERPSYDHSEVFNQRIAPLVDQIVAICKEHKIPVFIAAQILSNDLGAYVITAAEWSGTEGWPACPGLAKAALALHPNGLPSGREALS